MIRLVSVLLFVPMEVFACAIFTFTRDGQVYMGNNEDFVKPGVIWFVPGRGSRYGRVNVGFDNDFAQGSMNEKGLSFDAAALSPVPWEEDPDKESPRNLLEKIMNECATVREALGYFETYNCRHLADGQFMFADATGDSAVVAWLPKTGLSVVRRSGESQVVTNTRLESSSYRCSRFTRATQVLSGADASVSDMAEVLDAIHQRGPGAFTSYSTVYDLTQRKVFVYNLANFDEVVEFDLMTELAKGKRRTVELAKAFEESPSLDEIRSGEQRSMWDTRVTLDDSILQR